MLLGYDLALVETEVDGAVEWPGTSPQQSCDHHTKKNKVIFILGTYMELVDREVIGKQKELSVDTVQGVFGAKIELWLAGL